MSALNNYEKDEHGYYVMIDGKKIYQAEEQSEADIEFNERVNDWRISKMSIKDYLNSNI